MSALYTTIKLSYRPTLSYSCQHVVQQSLLGINAYVSLWLTKFHTQCPNTIQLHYILRHQP